MNIVGMRMCSKNFPRGTHIVYVSLPVDAYAHVSIGTQAAPALACAYTVFM